MHMDLYCLVWDQWCLEVLWPYGQRWTDSKVVGGRKEKKQAIQFLWHMNKGIVNKDFLWLVCNILFFRPLFVLLSCCLLTTSLSLTHTLAHINQLIVRAMPLLRETAALKAGCSSSVAWSLCSSWQEFNCSFYKEESKLKEIELGPTVWLTMCTG